MLGMSCLSTLVNSGNVLFWFAHESKSRIIRIKPLVFELLRREHTVTWVMPSFYENELQNVPNLTAIYGPHEMIGTLFEIVNTPQAFDGEVVMDEEMVTEYSVMFLEVTSAVEVLGAKV